MFDHPTIAALAAFLAARQAAEEGGSVYAGALLLPGNSDSYLALGPPIRQPGGSMADAQAPQAHGATQLLAVSARYPGDRCSAAASARPFWGSMARSADLQAVVPLERWDMAQARSD